MRSQWENGNFCVIQGGSKPWKQTCISISKSCHCLTTWLGGSQPSPWGQLGKSHLPSTEGTVRKFWKEFHAQKALHLAIFQKTCKGRRNGGGPKPTSVKTQVWMQCSVPSWDAHRACQVGLLLSKLCFAIHLPFCAHAFMLRCSPNLHG